MLVIVARILAEALGRCDLSSEMLMSRSNAARGAVRVAASASPTRR
jgi:hypothetical protein